MKTYDSLKARAEALRLHGLLAHWPEAVTAEEVLDNRIPCLEGR